MRMTKSFLERLMKGRRTPARRRRTLHMQWHITGQCNRRCRHCYQESYSGAELSFSDLCGILDQFCLLRKTWEKEYGGVPVSGHITLTGGEPFIRPDFLNLLDRLAAQREAITFAILTNGSYVDAGMARRLKALNPSYVQISIEGTQETHDAIRGKGDFASVQKAVRHLVRERVPVYISFTAHKANVNDFDAVARFCGKMKVTRLWADRLIPAGSGSLLKDQVLSSEETHHFFRKMYMARNRHRSWGFGNTEIAMNRALQFLVGGGRPYRCRAGDTLITVQANGDLVPCRRMPIKIGNLMEASLVDLYYNSELLRKLRDAECIGGGCQGCFYMYLCRGGLRCLSYALTGDPFSADPGCWLAGKSDAYRCTEVMSA
jgi:radical SAM protein with 4Fe4S-binding SPASM domain